MSRRVVLLVVLMVAQSFTLVAGREVGEAAGLGFAVRDVQGGYALRLEGTDAGQRVAFIGSVTADGAGAIHGQLRLNTGGTVVTRVVDGTYDVFPNGQGTMDWNVRGPDGVTLVETRSFHFAIHGRKTVLEIVEITFGNETVLTGTAARQ